MHRIWYHLYLQTVQTWQSSIDSIPPHTTLSSSTAHFSDYMSTRGYNSKGSELRWRSAACRSLGSALANHTSEAASHRNQAHKNHPNTHIVAIINTCEHVVLAERPGRHHCSHNELWWKELAEQSPSWRSDVFKCCKNAWLQKGLWIHNMEELFLVDFWHMMAIHSSGQTS